MPNLPLFFARRYLFSKKSHSVINIISVVSAFAVSIPVAAMIILLSVFNGLEGMVKGMYSSFDPQILITPAKGKVFDTSLISYEKLRSIEGIAEVSYYLEENALFEYRGRQFVGMMRGVDSSFNRVVPIDTLITHGRYSLQFGDMPEAVVGQGVAYTLGIRTNLTDPISVYMPRRGKINSLLPISFLRQEYISPAGIFALEAEVDGQYIIVPIDFARHLLDYEGKATGIMIKLEEGVQAEKIQRLVSAAIGDEFNVLTRYQQKESYYTIMMYEKWGIYFIILLVLLVASFSLIGSLAMLIIDKRTDMQTLIKMGADIRFVRRIFTIEGVLIYCIGAMFGLMIGLIVTLAQQHFGFIKISGTTFLIDAYPVKVKLTDILWIIVTFTGISIIISKLTVITMIPKKEITID